MKIETNQLNFCPLSNEKELMTYRCINSIYIGPWELVQVARIRRYMRGPIFDSCLWKHKQAPVHPWSCSIFPFMKIFQLLHGFNNYWKPIHNIVSIKMIEILSKRVPYLTIRPTKTMTLLPKMISWHCKGPCQETNLPDTVTRRKEKIKCNGT